MFDPTSKNLLKSSAGPTGVSDISSLEDKFSSGIFRSPSDGYLIETPCRGLGDASQVLLQGYNEAYRRLFRDRMTMTGSLLTEPREIDFSLLISPLSKILETELNGSIGQWFRAQVGVPMPQYYCAEMDGWRPTPAQEAEFGHFDVDFGKPSITIGGIIRLMRHYQDKGALPASLARHPGLIDTCDRLRRHRNTAAHSGTADRVEFEKCHADFTALASGGVFVSLDGIRGSLLGS
jgi:hypothetical protein